MKVSQSEKISRTLKVSSSAVTKTIKRYVETGSHEDRHNKGRPRVTSPAEDKFIRVTSLRNYSPNKWLSKRHVNISCSEETESGLHGLIAAKKALLKDTNKKKRLAWTKKHEQWTLDWWKTVLWSDESKFEIFGSSRYVFVRRRVGEQMISSFMVPAVKHGGGGVMLWGCFAGDTLWFI